MQILQHTTEFAYKCCGSSTADLKDERTLVVKTFSWE